MHLSSNEMARVKRYIFVFMLSFFHEIPQFLCTGLHAQPVIFSTDIGSHFEQQSICPAVSVGGKTFPGFYIMSQFHIAELARRGTVQKVSGSSPQHVAYNIGPAFNFRINTRSAYPLGLPEEFAFVTELRMTDRTISKKWNIWQMQDVNGDEQLAVSLNGESQYLQFTSIGTHSWKHTVVFGPLPSLFNDKWHIILLDVSKDSVSLFVDCVLIDTRAVPPRKKVSLGGFTMIGKLQDNPVFAVPVGLKEK